MKSFVPIDTYISNSMPYLRFFLSIILSCSNLGTCRGVSEVKSFCEIVLK